MKIKIKETGKIVTLVYRDKHGEDVSMHSQFAICGHLDTLELSNKEYLELKQRLDLIVPSSIMTRDVMEDLVKAKGGSVHDWVIAFGARLNEIVPNVGIPAKNHKERLARHKATLEVLEEFKKLLKY